MFKRLIYFSFLLSPLSFLLSYTNAQTYHFDHLSTIDGLCSNQINTILQDKHGFVWIGSSGGLNSYDGYEVKRYDKPFDTGPYSNIGIKCLYEDIDGDLWIGTMNHGAVKYDPVSGDFLHFEVDPWDSFREYKLNINTIYQDKRGTIWVGSYGGLSRYNNETGTFTYYLPYPQNPDSSINFIFSLMEDNDGTFWIGSRMGVYYFNRSAETFQPFSKKLDIPAIFQQISCLYQDEEGIIWIGTLKGLFKYVKNEDELIHVISQGNELNDHLGEDLITSIQESKLAGKKDLWIATRNGLIEYDKMNDQFIRILIDPPNPKSLSNNSINSLWMNDQGILWIATAWSGINKLGTRGNPFHQVQIKSTTDRSLYAPESFFMDRSGYLWVGAVTGGLFKFDPQMNRMAQYNEEKGFAIDMGQGGLVINTPECIFESSDGTLWVGLAGWGPAIFDRKKESFIYLDLEVPEGYSRPDRCSDIVEDKSGTIWFATDGLYKKEKTDDRRDPFKIVDNELLKKYTISDIFEDSRGNLFFGTYGNGLFCLRSRDRLSMNFIHYGRDTSESEGLYKAITWQITEDEHGTIWAVSSKGLNKFIPETDRFELITDTTGLFDDGLCQVYSDHKGNLWLGHYTKGLIRYNSDKKKIKIYTSRDGLPFDGIVPRYWYQSQDGRIFIGSWLGDGNGFFYFHPDNIVDNTHIPGVVITDFRIKNESFFTDSTISAKQHITLKYYQNFFSFQFAALDYTNPEKNQYAYYLEGLDENWIYTGNICFANYTSVPPGEYIFRVKGSNNDGYWNEEGAAIAISIFPPPWKTWWAYTLYGIFLVGLIVAWREYDLKRLRLKHALEIEHVEAHKLRELDNMKSRFFANISHEFRTPLTLILGPLQKLFARAQDEETKQELNVMHRSAKRLLNLINQLLDLSRLEAGKMELKAGEENMVTLVRSYVQQFESLAKHKGITLEFKPERDDIPAIIDRDKIEKILYNLLSNAFKFTGSGGRIGIKIASSQYPVASQGLMDKHSPATGYRLPATDDSYVEISISDTGLGIPPGKLPHIFDRFYQAGDSYTKDGEGTGIGLALTKELVEMHSGTITVESVVNQGSTFRVYLPLGKQVGNRQLAVSKGNIEPSSLSIADINVPTANCQLPTETSPKEAPLLLIIEDNADLRQYIRGYLEGTYRILEAGDGQQGLRLALEYIPDLIISDVMMPKMDGIELCRKVKSDIRTSHIAVILVTARASTESKLEGLATGADEYLYKPFNPHELIVRVHNMIQQQKKLSEYFIKKLGISGKFVPEAREISFSSLDKQFLTKSRKVVEENMSNPDFSVDGFAKLVGMSRSHLHKKMTALVNLSPSDFVRTLRLSRAAQRLRQKSGTVSEIAFDVGFNNLSYFSRSFQEQFGVLPSEYSRLEKIN